MRLLHLTSTLLRAGAALTLLGLCVLAQPAQAGANLVTNGSFESCASPPCGFEQVTNSDLPGWQTTSGYSFIEPPGGATNNAYGGTLWAFPATSPDGGNFLLQDSNYETGTLTQVLNGLVIGQAYAVSFFQAAGQQSGYSGATTDYWQVSFGTDTTQNSTLMSVPSESYVGWMPQTLTFIANATSAVLGFMAVGSPAGGEPPFAALDGVAVVTTVPEPATYLLLAGALAGLCAIRRRIKTT